MSRNFLVLLAACSLGASPVSAQSQGLVVKMGEVWLFHLENGQPAGAHPASPDAKLAPNELMVKVEAINGTLMSVTNNSDKFLNYRAAIVAGGHEKPTSVCTLLNNGRGAFEMWPYPIGAIRLSDFEPAAENTMVCK